MKLRIKQVCIGVTLLAIGINIMLASDLGVSGFDSLGKYVAELLDIQVGNGILVMQLFYVVILLITLLFRKIKLNELLLSLISIIIETQMIVLFSFISFIVIDNIYLKLLTFIIGLIFFSIGLTYFMVADLVITPADKFIVVFSNIFNINIGVVKLIHDILLLFIIFVISISFGGVYIQVGTLILTFSCGYIIKYMQMYIK